MSDKHRRRRRRRTETSRTLRALLDFGASGARAVLTALTDGEAEILASGAASGEGRAIRQKEIAHLGETALSTAEAETTRYRALPAIADEAIIGVSGTLLQSVPIVLRIPRHIPDEPLSHEEVRQVFARIRRQVQEHRHRLEAEDRVTYHILGTELIGVVVDTEQVRGLPGPMGTPLAIATCSFLWPKTGLDLMIDVTTTLDLELAGVVPVLQAVARALPVSDAVILDIGHEHTGIGLVEGRRLSHSSVISWGGLQFTETIRQRLPISQKAASVAKHRYALGHGSPVGRHQIATTLMAGITTWCRLLEQELERLAGQIPLPPQVLLFGGGSRIPDLQKQLQDHRWPMSVFESAPTVEHLYPYQLRNVQDPNGTLQTLDQVGVAALAAWAARTPTELEQLLEE